MALHESHRAGMERLIAEISPNFQVPPNAKFVIEDEKQFPGFNPVYLFRDGLALITPLLWLLFALNLMGFFFLLSWTPTLLTAAHLPPPTAALAGASIQLGGTVGSLLMAAGSPSTGSWRSRCCSCSPCRWSRRSALLGSPPRPRC